MKKVAILLLIILCAIFIGFETAAKVIGFPSYNIGYILAFICFVFAVVLGSKS